MAAYSESDSRDFDELGEVGTLSGGALDYAIIWKIVKNAHIPLSDIEDNWSFDRLMSFANFLQMDDDYKSAWQEFYRRKSENG